jgi:hypothetical protein
VASTWSTDKPRGSEERRKFGWKPGGDGAHREAEVAAMAALKLLEWRGVRCPRQASRACNASRKGDGAQAWAKGAEKRAMGHRRLLKISGRTWVKKREGRGGQRGCVHVEEGDGGEGGGGGWHGGVSSGRPATTPDRRAR